MRGSVALVLTVSAISALLPLGAAGIDGDPQTTGPADYRALIDAYRGGQRAALDRIGTATEADVHDWIESARADRGHTWTVEELRAAAIAHTEAWAGALANRRPESAALHLRAATRLFERVRDDGPAHADYIDRWRTVVQGVLARLDNSRQAEEFESRASALFPTHPRRVLAARAFNKGLGAERLGSAYRGEPAEAFRVFEESSRRRWWTSAAGSYLTALNLDPSYEMAALHLGRIRLLLGESAEAAQRFTKLVDAGDPRTRYLARLFLASLAERDGRDAEAERGYRSALAAYPWGQSASVALSQLFSRTGQETTARAIIAELGERGASVEPFWTYLPPARLDLADCQMLLNELRAEVRK
jgi:tetratricopeptide (TPR) repeat protein